ncbi:hypothetical protein SAMN04489729_0311 [Amycolatopsis lurida]|uniref:Uncharacterized protein n=1 Tax=Amycolatopsis lurida NRRL 2430 TaxID=1460371 RepID=A0A2P2FYL0_AMYLU|nr:DUF6348 family protein [Amycolatopsis lurida]KFU81821.1 hypothetical protein BB31_08185 [Amycolatopsis lurida NRRL 2430]SEB32640.1 hypothetical protein SAMN04489729_0311 [Amycolatopsis lurida]
MIASWGLDGALEVGIAAFCAGEEPPSDDVFWERLTGAGVEPWLAERLLVFLPMAYVRRLLPDVTYPEAVRDSRGQVLLAQEPVFVAAFDRAQYASRAEFERIAFRSSTFAVINEALNSGSQLADLELAEPVLFKDLEPAAEGDGGVPSPQAIFEAFLREHGIPLGEDARVDTNLVVHPAPEGVVMAQIDFAVSHPALAEPWLVESFAGHGPTWREAIGRAVNMFSRGALHPLIEGLLLPSAAADQVQRERYEHPAGAFELVLGAQITMFSETVPSVEPLLDRVLEALRAEELSRKVHGLRLFVAHNDGVLLNSEVLLDSRPWSGGEAVVAAHPALLAEGRVATRVFGLLVPLDS